MISASTLSTTESNPNPKPNPNPTSGELRSSFTVNLSSVQLSSSQLSLLDKGLTFIPTYRSLPLHTIYSMQHRVIRNLKLKDYFREDHDNSRDEDDDDDFDYTTRRFIRPSTWTPPDHKVSQQTLETIQIIINSTETAIGHRRHDNRSVRLRKHQDNLTPDERLALDELRRDDRIVIKPADKGASTVVMDKSAYVTEVRRQLDNTTYYRRLEAPIYQQNVPKINAIVNDMREHDYISDRQATYLRASETDRHRTLYILPKIHKARSKWPQPNRMPEGRPIVSDCSSESYRVSQFIDSFIRPISVLHPSYLKDTYDFISKVRHRRLPKNAILVTGDVVALYTNMTFDRTLATTRAALHKHPCRHRPDDHLLRLLELTMTNNDFQFDGEYYLQTCGMAMGKTYAPSLADIYMEDFDERAHHYHIVPELYYRFLDDIFFFWTSNVDELRKFETYLNSLIDGIKVTLNWSEQSVDFLDTTVYRHVDTDADTDVIYTRVFFKETDTHQLLHRASFHPRHTARGVLKSQILRFKRLSTTKTDYNATCSILFQALAQRGYSRSLMRKMKRDIWLNDFDSCHQAVNKRRRQPILPIVVPFNDLGTELAHHWRRAISANESFAQLKLVTAYTAGHNLRRKLVHSSLSPTLSSSFHTQPSSYPPSASSGTSLCPHTKCRACNYITYSQSIHSSTNGKSFRVRGTINCKSRNIVYVITCKKCRQQYVGETSRTLADRINDHLSAIRCRKQTPIGIHFGQTNHSISNFSITGVERFEDTTPSNIRRIKEITWQHLLQTAHPYGINNLKKNFVT